MKIRFTILFGILFTTIVTEVDAQEIEQNSKESKVIISESSLISLTNTLKKFKKQKERSSSQRAVDTLIYSQENNEIPIEVRLLKQDITQLEDQLRRKNAILNEKSNSIPDITRNVQDEKISALQQEVFELKLLLNKMMINEKTPTIISVPVQKNEILIDKLDSLLKVKDSEKIQQRIDSLYIAINDSSEKDSLSVINDISLLKEQLQKLEIELNSYKKNLETKNAEVDISMSFKDYKKQIFFENNRFNIRNTDIITINELVEIISSNDKIDILIKGFASNKGTPIQNEKLSMLRAESVKKELIRAGVHTSRIHTQYHGIDYGATNEALARRVDINLLVKRSYE